jgi:steroid 5-alpha reductase family enzyme
VILTAVFLSGALDLRAALAAGMVLVWALRLASFLFRRIARAGGDSRFDQIKTRPLVFLMAWTLQGLWVLLTAAAALAIITGGTRAPLGIVGGIGLAVWAAGFAIEIVADRQKSQFKADPANEGRFIRSGLWAWSRHPNYFGEILLWAGMAILAVPVLQGWQWATLISPVFVTVLLTRISGIPILERQADARWGDEPEYQEYKRRTPVLLLRRPH